MITTKNVLEEELIIGARERTLKWQAISFILATSMLVAVVGLVVVVTKVEKPAPALVPFDPSTGVTLPMANVGTISLAQKDAVLQSLVYAYIRDRETYNPMDNDIRIEGVFHRSTGEAAKSLQRLWNNVSDNDAYPPRVYGQNARMDVAISSISKITKDRILARMTKRLMNKNGVTEGQFNVTLAYQFDASTLRNLDEIWANPFGFSVSEYSVTAERFKEGDEK